MTTFGCLEIAQFAGRIIVALVRSGVRPKQGVGTTDVLRASARLRGTTIQRPDASDASSRLRNSLMLPIGSAPRCNCRRHHRAGAQQQSVRTVSAGRPDNASTPILTDKSFQCLDPGISKLKSLLAIAAEAKNRACNCPPARLPVDEPLIAGRLSSAGIIAWKHDPGDLCYLDHHHHPMPHAARSRYPA
jgi:hypothetical protein